MSLLGSANARARRCERPDAALIIGGFTARRKWAKIFSMTYGDLQTLVDYHYWARDRVLDAVARLSDDLFTRDLGNSFPSVRDTLTHLYAAEWVWCSRWNGKSGALSDAGSFATVADLRQAWEAHEAVVRATLAAFGEPGVDRIVEYQRGGRLNAEPFSQQLQHMVNHGTYHRGQVTTMLRQLGAEPPKSMDLISFYRERKGEG